ncbi:hypothetical protein [Bacillus sp. JCM 19041]|uniref:hypothetical protein n=1 Tax=Bacillus sp. JCM 19041 TaxID=1460637 RepID=UPI0006CFB642
MSDELLIFISLTVVCSAFMIGFSTPAIVLRHRKKKRERAKGEIIKKKSFLNLFPNRPDYNPTVRFKTKDGGIHMK